MEKSKSQNYAWVVMAAGFFTQILACWGVAVWGMNLAIIAADFEVQTKSLAIGASLFGLGYGGTSVFWGNLADRIGIRKVLSIGGIIGAALIACAGFFDFGIPGLIALYTLAGLMLGAIGNGVTPKLVSTWFATHQRGKGFLITIIGGSFGGVLLGIIAPMFIKAGGWRLCFEMIGAIGVVLMVLAFVFVRDSPAAVGTLPYGSDKEEGAAIDQKQVDAKAQSDSNKDRMLRVLKMPITWVMILIAILFQLFYTSHQTYMVASVVSRGYDITAAGLCSTIVLAGTCISFLVFSPLSDRFPRKNLLGILFIAEAIFYIIFYFLLKGNAPIGAIYAVALCIGLCFGFFCIIQAVESELFEPDLRGAGPGMISTFTLIGKFCGPLLAAAAIGWFGGDTWNFILVAAPLCCLAGVIALAALPKTGGKYGDPMAEKYKKRMAEQAEEVK